MTIHQLILVLRARWRMCLLVWCGVFGSVLAFNLAASKQYTSVGTVVVDARGVDAMAGGAGNSTGSVPGYMATQVDVAQSERVVSMAARAMNLDADPVQIAKWKSTTAGRGSFLAWLTEQIQRRYVVRPSRESNAMTMAFTDRDADFSAKMTNALMQAYIDTTLELRVEPAKQYNQFFDERSRVLRRELETAQNRLSAYQRESGLLASDERFDVENARLSELSSQVVSMQNAAAESGSRQTEAVANPDRVTDVLNSSLINSLEADLTRQVARLQELQERYGTNYPQRLEAEASIESLRSRLAAAKRVVVGGVEANNNVVRTRLGSASQALAEQRAKVVGLQAKRDEAAVLQRDAQNAQKAYDAVLNRVSQTDLESQNRQTNVSVLQNASPPAFPAAPRIVFNAAVAALLGGLLAVALAWLREMADRRMRSEADVSELLGIPLLMVLPHASFVRRRGHNRLIQRKQRVLGGDRPALSQ